MDVVFNPDRKIGSLAGKFLEKKGDLLNTYHFKSSDKFFIEVTIHSNFPDSSVPSTIEVFDGLKSLDRREFSSSEDVEQAIERICLIKPEGNGGALNYINSMRGTEDLAKRLYKAIEDNPIADGCYYRCIPRDLASILVATLDVISHVEESENPEFKSKALTLQSGLIYGLSVDDNEIQLMIDNEDLEIFTLIANKLMYSVNAKENTYQKGRRLARILFDTEDQDFVPFTRN